MPAQTKVAVIKFTATENDLYPEVAGNFTLRELNWALDQLKQQILNQGSAQRVVIPGMLKGDGKRVPS